MKAAVYQGIEHIDIVEVPDPVCPEDGLLVRVESCGLCGSEVRTFYAGTAYHSPGRILGHEAAGTVIQVGPNATGFQVGDRLAMGPVVPCNECFYCQRGLQNLCENRYPGHFPQAFAQLTAVPAEVIRRGCVVPIPDDLSFDGATLAEPLSSVLKAHLMINTSVGDTVVVMGAGPIGNMHVQMARLQGATKIIQTELIAERLEMARPFGADVFINASQEDAEARILAETGKRGADIVISATPSTKAAAEALKYSRKGGKVVWFGGLPSTDPMITVDGNLVHYRDLVIYGSIGFAPRHYRLALELIASRKIDPALYITGTLPLEGIVEGMETMKAGKAIKLAIRPNG